MTGHGYPRDLRGDCPDPPHPHWPGEARIAVQFVVNFEEGGENNILHGDRASEAFCLTCSVRSLAVRVSRQYRIDVRIWLARGLLAAVANFHRTKIADDGVRRRNGPETKSQEVAAMKRRVGISPVTA